MEKVLIVEDDLSLGDSLNDFLKKENFDVSWTKSLAETRTFLEENKVDIIILDWMLPDGQGLDFLKSWMNHKNYVPVIMLTARTDLLDKVIGLESGASDYMTKPFQPRELVARLRVQLRAKSSEEIDVKAEKIELRDLVIDPETREVLFEGNEVYMTKMEYELLKTLAQNPGRPYTRDELLNTVWGFEFTPSTRTVDTHVLQLRQKLDEKMIETVRGVGYRFSREYGS